MSNVMNVCLYSCFSYRACKLYLLCHIISSSMASLAVPYFSVLSHKWHNFAEMLLDIKVCFDFLCKFLSETFAL
jgi:hypothetical protein